MVKSEASWLLRPKSLPIGSGRNSGAPEKLLEANVRAQGIEARVYEDEGQCRTGFESVFEDGNGPVVVTQSRINVGDAKGLMIQRAVLLHPGKARKGLTPLAYMGIEFEQLQRARAAVASCPA